MYCFTRRSQNKTECRGSDKGRHHPTIPADRYQQLKEHFRIRGSLKPLGRILGGIITLINNKEKLRIPL